MSNKSKSNWVWVIWIVIFIIIGSQAGNFLGSRKVDQIKEKFGISKKVDQIKEKFGISKKVEDKKLFAHYAGLRNGFMSNLYYYSDGSCEFSVYASNDSKNFHMGCKSSKEDDWKPAGVDKKGYYYCFGGNQIANGIENENLKLNVYYSTAGERWSDGWPSAKQLRIWTLYEKRHRKNGLMVDGANIREERFNPPVLLLRKK